MSAKDQLDGLKNDISDAYTAIQEKGGEVPENGGSMGLADAIRTITQSESIEYIPGDGIKIDDKVISVKIPVKDLTEEEYNALSQAEKNSSLCFVRSEPAKVGEAINWAGYNWIVVNDNGDGTIVLAMQDIYELTTFGSNNIYASSTLAARAKAFEDSLSDEALEKAIETTVNGVTAKVFVASQEQVFNSGFSYFISNASRIAEYGGDKNPWWTSTPHTGDTSRVRTVAASGIDTRGAIASTYGFRPFITIYQFQQKTTIYLNGKEIDQGVTMDQLQEFLAGKQDTLTGKAGQVVGFDESGNAVAQDAPTGGGEVYSTEETVIGRWIDGRPLYQKTYMLTSPSKTGTNETIASLDENIIVRSCIGAMYSNENNETLMIPHYSGNTYMTVFFPVSPHRIAMYLSNSGYANRPMSLTLEYTKATD